MALHTPAGTVGVASLLATALNYAGLVSSPESTVDLDQVLRPWNWSAADVSPGPPPCAWTGPDTIYTSPMCTHWMIARTPHDALASARERALACAALASTSCILSPEVGFSVPAVFVYDSEVGIKTLLAPRIDERKGEAADTLLLHPVTGENLKTTSFHEQIVVETQVNSIRRLEQLHLDGEAAYCVQLLWAHYSSECNANLA